MNSQEQLIVECPKGWEIDKIENGKVIFKKFKYPKTWEECIDHLEEGEFIDDDSYICRMNLFPECELKKSDKNILPVGYGKKVLALCQLLVCRNAYWGDWRPDWKKPPIKYTIRKNGDEVVLEDGRFYSQILAFPNREMRNVFYENFKDLIEEAKELL